MIRLDGPKITVSVGNRQVGYYRLAEALRTLPPGVGAELLDALDRELRRLLRRPSCRRGLRAPRPLP